MDRRLIGRHHEQDLLEREWHHALAGHTSVAVVAGEPGIGKTRLLSHMAARAEQQGALVLHGITSTMEGMPPYLPFLEALGQYIRTAPLARLRKQIGAHAPTLASLFPEITQRLGNLPPAFAIPPEQARFRLYEAIALFLYNVSRSRPVLLVLDDLQWADAASLDLLAYLVRHQPHARLLILGSVRSGEGMHADFLNLLAELERLRRVILIELAPLSADEVAELAGLWLGAPLEATAVQLLLARSEGNPFFVEELLRNWQDTGRLVRAAPGWRLDGRVEDEFPASIVRAIEGRLARLPAQTVEYLRSAAILGRQFEIGVLAEALGQDAESLEEDLSPAVQARLIRQDQRGFAFSHDLIREALYQQVPLTRRRRLHGLIGHALEARHQAQDAQHLSTLAFHFTRSGDRERGIRYARFAAAEALRACAPKEALLHYQTALDALDQMEHQGLAVPPQRGALLLELGEAAVQAGMEQDAIRAFEAALAWFRRAGDQRAAAHAAYGSGRAYWRIEQVALAEQAFRLALTLLGEQISPEAASIHADLANLLVLSRHQYTQALWHAQRALEVAQHLEDDRLMAAALRTLGNLHVRTNRLPEGIARLDNALALAIQSNDLAEAAETCTGLLIALAWSAQFQRTEQIAVQLIDLAERAQARYYLRHVYSLLFYLHMQQGNLGAAQQALMQAEQVVSALASPEPLALLQQCRAIGAYLSGDAAAMDAFMAEAITIFRALGPETLIWYLGLQALAKLECGAHAQARACRDELEALLRAVPETAFPAADAFAHLALFALASGDHDRLAALYPKLLPFRGQYHDALVDRLLGAIEIVHKEWDRAQASLDAAEASARREGLRWELAHTLVSRADLELARGGAGSALRARALLVEALGLFKAYGNAAQTKRVRERLRNLPRQPGEKPAQPTPAGLSRREVDVLRLIAAGKSNREIADELALSEKTIANHVTMIFNKIGVDNRAAAAAFAVRQGLV